MHKRYDGPGGHQLHVLRGVDLTVAPAESMVIIGGSGTGKTMAAEVLANELDLDLYRVDLSQVVRVKVEKAYPRPLDSFKGLSLRTEETRPHTLKMCQATNKKNLLVVGREPLQVVGHAGLSPKIWGCLF